jgi:hypothetical protein
MTMMMVLFAAAGSGGRRADNSCKMSSSTYKIDYTCDGEEEVMQILQRVEQQMVVVRAMRL